MGSPWNLVSAQGIPNASMMGLPDGRKSFKIGLVVLIQYRLWQTPSQPDRHVAVASTRTRISASCSKNSGSFKRGQDQSQNVGILRTDCRKSLTINPMVPVESIHSEGMLFAGHTPPYINNPKWGTRTHEKLPGSIPVESKQVAYCM